MQCIYQKLRLRYIIFLQFLCNRLLIVLFLTVHAIFEGITIEMQHTMQFFLPLTQTLKDHPPYSVISRVEFILYSPNAVIRSRMLALIFYHKYSVYLPLEWEMLVLLEQIRCFIILPAFTGENFVSGIYLCLKLSSYIYHRCARRNTSVDFIQLQNIS